MSVTFQNFALNNEALEVNMSYMNAEAFMTVLNIEPYTGEEMVGSIAARDLMDKIVDALSRIAASDASEYYEERAKQLFKLCLADTNGEITWC